MRSESCWRMAMVSSWLDCETQQVSTIAIATRRAATHMRNTDRRRNTARPSEGYHGSA